MRRRWCHRLWLGLKSAFCQLKSAPCQPGLHASSPASRLSIPPRCLTPPFSSLLLSCLCIQLRTAFKCSQLTAPLKPVTLYVYHFPSLRHSSLPFSPSTGLFYHSVLSLHTWIQLARLIHSSCPLSSTASLFMWHRPTAFQKKIKNLEIITLSLVQDEEGESCVRARMWIPASLSCCGVFLQGQMLPFLTFWVQLHLLFQ